MKFSLNHIRWYGYGDVVSRPVDEIVKLVGAQLGEIEEVINLGERYDKILVARVVSCDKHPNADKLHVCKIDDGGVADGVERDEKGYVQVVCGAPNVREGLMVAWLPPGSVVPSSWGKDPFTLEARELRGMVSNGMLASPAELGISDNHDGLLEITSETVGQDNATPGMPFKQLYGLDDTVIDIENKMFTHRPDCFGMLGVARELAGIQNMPFASPDWYLNPTELKSEHDPDVQGLSVTVDIPDLVPRYQAIVMSNIQVAPSPVWLQSFLTRLGVKPINNIVDMTNYMMLATGQPLHAFDFDKIAKDGAARIVVRQPKAGEKLGLLDGKTIEPRAEAILICDDEKPIALGGVMGGNNSEIDQNTTRIVIESANFDMYNIRRTSMAHGLFTDAVTRFNKGQSPWQTAAVLAKAVEMTKELCPEARIASEPADVATELKNNPEVRVDASFINERLGLSLSVGEITERLRNVEFDVKNHGDELNVTAPFWRTDIAIAEDVVEEVGRLYGYDHLPLTLPLRALTPAKPDVKLALKKQLRDILSKAGANEVLTYSFVHGNLLKKVGQDPGLAFELSNALSPDLQYYRMSLMPSVLDKVHGNIKAGYDEFALFEMNKTHIKLHKDDDPTDPGLPYEINMLALVFVASDKAAKQYVGAPYYQARIYLDYLASQLNLTFTYTPFSEEPEYPVMKPYDWSRAALVGVAGTEIVLGTIGEFRQDVHGALKLPSFTAGFEIGLSELLEAINASDSTTYMPLARFPRTSQDISFKTKEAVSYASLHRLLSDGLAKAAVEHGYNYSLDALDIYQPSTDNGDKHMAFRITLWHDERTLTTDEVTKVLDELAVAAKDQLKAERI